MKMLQVAEITIRTIRSANEIYTILTSPAACQSTLRPHECLFSARLFYYFGSCATQTANSIFKLEIHVKVFRRPFFLQLIN